MNIRQHHPKFRMFARSIFFISPILHLVHILPLNMTAAFMIASIVLTSMSAIHDKDIFWASPHRPKPTLFRLVGKVVFLTLYYLYFSVHPTQQELTHWIIVFITAVCFGIVIGYGIGKKPGWK